MLCWPLNAMPPPSSAPRDDLLSIATLGFRGEALPSIASIARVELVTRAAEESAGTRIEIAGGKLLGCDDAGAPAGTTITVRDLFFNTPARRKFLKSENTELAHVTALVTHYALAHPDKHFELHSATHALLVAPPVRAGGGAHLSDLRPGHARSASAAGGGDRIGPRRAAGTPAVEAARGLPGAPAGLAAHYRLYLQARARETQSQLHLLLRQSPPGARPPALHAVSEAYRNILPPTSFPVVLLFVEMPPEEVDVNVHPAKTEVRFRQASWLHDFVRDTIRHKLTLGRPAAGFLRALTVPPQQHGRAGG